MEDLPRKLKTDAIAEALFDIRFDCPESNRIPEFVLSKLTRFAAWQSYEIARTPFADFPFQARMQDPNLRGVHLMEMKAPSGKIMVKVGTHVLSFHRLAPYPGWKTFSPELDEVVDHLFAQLPDLTVTRLGFRYINLFENGRHGVAGLRDLHVGVSIAGAPIDVPFNLNYTVTEGELKATVKMASREFIQPQPKPSITVALDLDVSSESPSHIEKASDVKSWIEKAHTLEKRQFFRLLTPAMFDELGAGA